MIRGSSKVAVLLTVMVFVGSGCGQNHTADNAAGVEVDLALRPDPPVVGMTTATVTLTEPAGQPVRGAAVKLEGNMNHAGMTPSFADAPEVEPGQYRGELELTMGGDWFVLISARLADGRALKRKVDIPGVRSR
jgi:hypothetical protein